MPSLRILLALTLAAGPAATQSPQALAARPDVRRAFAVIDSLHPGTIRDQIALAEIPAPPFLEAARAARFAELLRDAGADSVWTDAEGNVLALRRGTMGRRTVVLSAHLDTVFPEGTDVTVRVAGDTLFGPGIADDTRGLATVLTVLRALEAAAVTHAAHLLFVGTVGEEGLGDLRGVKHLFRDGAPRIDAFISVDGADPARIVHEALGSHRYRVTVRGPGGHSWSDFGTANPHHALGTAIRRFVDLADPFTRTGPTTSYNVGRIGGGTSVNSIPFESWMEVDMRSISPARLAGVDSLFQRAMREGLAEHNAVRRAGPPLTMDIERIGARPSGSIPADHPLVAFARGAVEHFGWEAVLERSSTDANAPIARGIPAITIGGGGVEHGTHSLDEYWVDRDSARGIQFALLVTLGWAEGGTR